MSTDFFFSSFNLESSGMIAYAKNMEIWGIRHRIIVKFPILPDVSIVPLEEKEQQFLLSS